MNILYTAVLIWLLNSCLCIEREYLGDLPLENPDLLGGDILGFEGQDRTAIPWNQMLWPGGVVPYELDPGLSKTVFPAIMKNSFYVYARDTCIRFVPRTNENDYIRIFSGDGCYSHVGRTGGAQPVSLGVGCGYMGTVLHELAHALGFWHEQNRSDRDEYITINWENIQEGMEDQFFKLGLAQNKLLTPFDYDSLMLYGSYSFSRDKKNKLKTMVGKGDRHLEEVINKWTFSRSDLLRIRMLYNCSSKST